MKITDPRITILINQEYTTIELYDAEAGVHLFEVKLTPDQLSSAMSRLSHTKCSAEIFNTEKANKKMEINKLVFNIDGVDRYSKGSKKILSEMAAINCPEGWEHDDYFGSQDTFFSDNGHNYARVTIRRWVNSEPNPERSVATKAK